MKYYTYIHYRKDTMEPFYIGKGQGSQYQVKTGRSKKWEEAVKQHDFIPVKVCFWESENDAYTHEEFLIECFRNLGYNLCNIAGGGKNGLLGTKHPESVKDKIRQKALGRPRDELTKQKLREYNSTPEMRKIIGDRFRGPKPKIECKICGKSVPASMLSRWHKH